MSQNLVADAVAAGNDGKRSSRAAVVDRRASDVWLLAAVLLVATAAALATLASPAPAQSALERTPSMDGPWVSELGTAQFNLVHRFWITGPPSSKVINSPTLLVSSGLGRGVMAGFRYASNSTLTTTPNEWELFGRWKLLTQDTRGLDAGVTAAWNSAAESFDGALSLARSVGPVRLLLSARAFSSFGGGEGEAAVGGGAVWRLHRNIALAGDVMTMATVDTTPAWGIGLQLRIPTTPHTVSLHATTANVGTLQSSAFGSTPRDPGSGDPRILYGFEFTVPVTFSRYTGGARPAPSMETDDPATDTAAVGMDNRLRFLPDTVRIQVGEAVRWENTSDRLPTVTADPELAALESSVALPDGASPFNSGDLPPGAVYLRVFDVAGTYKYFCIPHERAGMIGWVVVEK